MGVKHPVSRKQYLIPMRFFEYYIQFFPSQLLKLFHGNKI